MTDDRISPRQWFDAIGLFILASAVAGLIASWAGAI